MALGTIERRTTASDKIVDKLSELKVSVRVNPHPRKVEGNRVWRERRSSHFRNRFLTSVIGLLA